MRPGRLVLLAVLAPLVAAPAARAATVTASSACYQQGSDVVVSGAGFASRSIVTVSRDGDDVGSAVTDAQGAFRGKFTTPSLTGGLHETLYDLVATDGQNTAISSYRATKVIAGFAPGSGNPKTLRVRFDVYGFGLFRLHPKVYLHYVRPNGRLRRSVYLGTASGTCGHIRRTRRRLLFPSTPTRGRWTLQFDTNRHYTKATAASRFAWVRKPVQVTSRR